MSFQIEDIDLIDAVDYSLINMPLIKNLPYTNISLGAGSNFIVQNGQRESIPLVLSNNNEITLNDTDEVVISKSGFYLLTFNFTANTKDLSNLGSGIGVNIVVNGDIEGDQSQSDTLYSNTTASQGQNFSSSWIMGLNSGDSFTIDFKSFYTGGTSGNLTLTRVRSTLNLISA
jgi:hypothetical protein